MDAADRAGLHRACRRAAGTRRACSHGRDRARLGAGAGSPRASPADDRGVRPWRTMTSPSAASASRACRTTPVSMPWSAGQLGDRRQRRRPGRAARSGSPPQRRPRPAASPGAGRRGSGRRTGTLRCSVNGLPVHARSPQRFSARVQRVEQGAADLPHLHGPEGRLDGAADVPEVALPRGHVPLGDRAYWSSSCATVRADSGWRPSDGLLEQLAELDLRRPFGLAVSSAAGSRGPSAGRSRRIPSRATIRSGVALCDPGDLSP